MAPRTFDIRWLLTAVFACGSAQPPAAPPDYELDDPALACAGDAQARPESVEIVGPPRLRRGTVSRQRLLEVLDQGLPVFLAHVALAPSFRDQQFAGWEFVRFWPGDSMFATVDLRPGDIVTAINGLPVRTAAHFFEIWTRLRDTAAIVVEGERESSRFELHFEVIDGPPSAVP